LTFLLQMGATNAKADLAEYQNNYPNATKREIDNLALKKNLKFYSNEIRSMSTGHPSGDFIDKIHEDWWGEYALLEKHHGYIQWLFPIHEQGLNHEAQKLQRHEAKAIRETPALQNRLIRSYEMQLDFYGMVVDRKTGKVSRNPKNWRCQYTNLNDCFHNYLRITRILKCLGEVGLERYKLPFLEHVGNEILVHGELTNAKDSLVRYWAPTLRDATQREALEAKIDKVMTEEKAKREKLRAETERKLKADRERAVNQPEDVVGLRVSVRWKNTRRNYYDSVSYSYYEGTVKSYDAKTKMHRVVYDDGDDQMTALGTQVFKFMVPLVAAAKDQALVTTAAPAADGDAHIPKR